MKKWIMFIALFATATALAQAPFGKSDIIKWKLSRSADLAAEEAARIAGDADGSGVTNAAAWRVALGLGSASTNASTYFVLSSEVNATNGVAGLDENALIPANLMSNVFTGGQYIP